MVWIVSVPGDSGYCDQSILWGLVDCLMMEVFHVYKGLQKPLVFKMFRGQFIYWGIGSITLGLLLCMILSSAVHLIVGIISLAIVTGGGLAFTAIRQKKGLHSKKRYNGIFILQANYQKHDQDKDL